MTGQIDTALLPFTNLNRKLQVSVAQSIDVQPMKVFAQSPPDDCQIIGAHPDDRTHHPVALGLLKLQVSVLLVVNGQHVARGAMVIAGTRRS